MATRTISTKLAVEGESEYKQALSNINTELGTLNTKLNLVKTEFQNHQNSMEALQSKSEALADKQAKLAEKVQLCKDAYSNAKTSLENYKTQSEKITTALEQNQTAQSKLSDETKAAGSEWLDCKNKVADAEAQLKVLQNTSGDTSEEEEKLNKIIQESKARMAELESSTNGAAKTAGELQEEEKELTDQLSKAEAGVQASTTACNKWESAENNAQIQLNKTNAEIELNDKYLKEAESSADGCATSIDEFGKQAKNTGESTQTLNTGLNAMQTLLQAAVLQKCFRELASAMKECVSAASDFEAQMSTVQALSGATSTELDELSAAAKQMGATTSFTATEAGEALEYMALAGWSTDEMLDGLSGVMTLAAAAGEDLATTSDIVTDALTAFGYSADSAGEFADVLAAASSNSNTTVSQLGEAFQQVGTTAGTLGYSIEDVSVALGLMANSGIKASTAGTGLATALTRMSGANETATAEMDALGISMFNADGSTKDLSTFLVELRTALNENCSSASDLTVATYNLAGQKGMKALQAIVNASDEDFNSLTQSINESAGAAEEMADTKLDNYAGQVTLLQSAFDALKTEIGEQLTPALGMLAEGATTILNWITDLIQKVPVLVPILAGLTTGVGALAVGLIAAKVAAKAFSLELNAIPIVAIISGVIALGTAIGTLVAKWKSNKEAMMDNTNAAKDLQETTDDLVQSYQDAQDEVDSTNENIDDLVAQYTALANKTSLTAGEQAVLEETIDRLNDAVPGLNAAYDEQTKTLSKTVANVTALAEAQKVDTQYQSDLEQLTDTETQLTKIYNQRASDQERLAEVQAALNDSSLQITDTETGEIMTKKELRQEEEDLTSAIENLDGQYDELNDQYMTLSESVNAYAEAQQEEAEVSNTQVTTAVENLGSQLIALQQNYEDVYDSALDSMKGQFDLWEEADEVVTTSFEDMMSALQSQEQYWEDYSDNLDNLMGRQIDGLDDLINAYGEDASAVASMAGLTDEELQEMSDTWHENQQKMEDAAGKYAEATTNNTNQVNDAIKDCIDQLMDMDLSEEERQLAYDTLAGYVEGLDEESDDVDAELVSVAQSSLDAFADELGIHSPSTKFAEYGRNSMQGYINGTDDQEGNVTSELSNVAQAALKAFTDKVNGDSLTSTGESVMTGYTSGVGSQSGSVSSKMVDVAKAAITSFTNNATSTSLKSAGSNTLQGFINGLNNTASSLYNKMSSIASNALSKFKKTLGIASPSTLMYEAAEFTTEGFVEGIEDTQKDAENSMANMAKSASDAFNESLNYDDMADAASSAYATGGLAPGAGADGSTLYVTIPIYVNGKYTKKEIAEIALEGLSRKQSNSNAVRGVTV